MFYQVLWDEDLTIPTQIVPIERNHQLPQHQQSCHQVLHNHEQHHHLVDHEQHPHLVDQGNHHHLVDQGGAEFNSAPARRLSAAFGLDLAPTTAGNKQVLLAYYDTQCKLCITKHTYGAPKSIEGYEVWGVQSPTTAGNKQVLVLVPTWKLVGVWTYEGNEWGGTHLGMRCERG